MTYPVGFLRDMNKHVLFIHFTSFHNSFSPSVDEFELPGPIIIPPQSTDAKTLERLSERSYVRDWHRLGLTTDTSPGSRNAKTEAFRLSHANAGYTLCRRYVDDFVHSFSLKNPTCYIDLNAKRA